MNWFPIEEVVKFILILLSLWGFWYLSGKDFILNRLEKFIPFDNDVENNKSGSKKHAHINYLKYVFRLIFVGLVSAFIIPTLTGTWFHNWPNISIGDDASLRTAILTATGGVVVLLTFIETHRKNIDDAFRDRKLKGLELLGSENSRSRLIGFDMLSVLIDEKINEGDKQEAQQILNHICNNISVSSKENKDKNISRANNHMVESIRRHYHKKDKYTKVSWSDLSLEFFDCDFKIRAVFKRMEMNGKIIFRNCRFNIVEFNESKINELYFIDCEFGYGVGLYPQEIVLDLSSVQIGKTLQITRCTNNNHLAEADKLSIDINIDEYKNKNKSIDRSSIYEHIREYNLKGCKEGYMQFGKKFFKDVNKSVENNLLNIKYSNNNSLSVGDNGINASNINYVDDCGFDCILDVPSDDGSTKFF
mgnify:FL=1